MARRNLPSHFPYHPGLELTIKEHIPPVPFAEPHFLKDAAPRLEVQPSGGRPNRTPLEWCLDFPPTETKPVKDPRARTLHVVEQVSCGAERTAQVLRCYLDGIEDKFYVAKIFDALYFLPEEFDHTYEADGNYATEAAAYEDIIEDGLDGRFTPHYHGSWTFDLPVPDSHTQSTRPVRMVLLEHIPGRSICEVVNNNLLSCILPEHRLEILAGIMEVYSLLKYYGIQHFDLAPRNVMIMGVDFSISPNDTMPGFVLIDFNHCSLHRRPSCYGGMNDDTKPVDPKTYLGKSCPDKWKCWVPEPHRSNPAAWRGWVRKLWPNSEDFSPPFFKSHVFDDLGDFIEVPPQPDKQDIRPPSLPTESDG
ncbi:unnamed protein product [Clonostachys rosea]|uniref:non-specific serine/threonine protein kinase n=1 Tax=Bionectria ochroleuca TaxID=29856 RepID=A0ABY6U0Y8_BIOOC|nr:unnamed protein product [Clonostachys rosea]